ncbi:L,D-transpeptidase [Rhizobium cauense]|uniref:L,D-transpeptidase n=1 Tax=Rhizobium cauense TaxID=1166683 RepID=UPI001C6E4B45|nr:L,D-transpeptidase [Rhizobium cauense]MBW9116780.1 L,D-transpeptidase [Rhizobium cauense]
MSVSIDTSLSRRSLLSLSAMAAASTLAGCVSTASTGRMMGRQSAPLQDPIGPVHIAPAPTDAELAVMYGPIEDGGFLIPAVPYKQIDPRYYRQQVLDPSGEAPGTIVVDTPSRFLYLVQPGGAAMRYDVGIGREGFAWQGNGVTQWRQEWPRWKPPNEMVARQPELSKYSIENGGMEPGLKNPLGARALYIFSGGQDTLYRLHGNPQWRSIGKAVSSGCVRLLNQDIIDLYERVPIKAPIVVKQ